MGGAICLLARGQLAGNGLVFTDLCFYPSEPQNNAPHTAVIKISASVPVGYFASYHVLIKTVPGDAWPYTLNVSVSTSGLSVCSVRVIQVSASCFQHWFAAKIELCSLCVGRGRSGSLGGAWVGSLSLIHI